MDVDLNSFSVETIVQKIKTNYSNNPFTDWISELEITNNPQREPPKQAAVLVPLFRLSDTWRILFTRRTDKLVEHSGQVSFPGGQINSEDLTAERAALRETWEEIGVQPKDIHVLGCLRNILTVTNYLITPIIGTIPWPYTFNIAFDEVSRIFSIPLMWLANPNNYEIVERELPPHMGIKTVFFKPYHNETLWGASARITLNLIGVLIK